MKHLLPLVGLIFILSHCSRPVKTKQYNFPEIGWTIHVPANLLPLDSVQNEKLNTKGRLAIEKTIDTTLDISATKSLITLQKDKLNSFSATITPFDPSVDGNWNETNEAVKLILLETLKSQAPGTLIDTASSNELIDGEKFNVFKSKMTFPNKIILTLYLYSKLYKGYDFGITITNTSDNTLKEFKRIISSSKFSK